MKIRITFKTPDAVHYAVEDQEDQEDQEELLEFFSEWVKYGECITVEFDTEENTATVLKIK